MYENDEFDSLKFSHSLFGDYTFQRSRTFKDFKVNYALPYNCFWDVPDGYVYGDANYKGPVKALLENETDDYVLNDVFAIMPNGMIIKYDFLVDGDFEEWIHSMYYEAYPN